MDEAFLARIDAADADLSNPFRANRGRVAANLGEFRRSDAAQARDRHAVDIAGGGEQAGVEVRMRIKPQHPQISTGSAAMAGGSAHRADSKAVITAEQNGQALFAQLFEHGSVYLSIPLADLGRMPVAQHRRLRGIGWAVQIPLVNDIQPASLK